MYSHYSALNITIIVPVDPMGNVTTRFKTEGIHDPRPQLERAICALQEELRLVDGCPVHTRPSP